MRKSIHVIGPDVHKESVTLSIAPSLIPKKRALRFCEQLGECGARFPRL